MYVGELFDNRLGQLSVVCRAKSMLKKSFKVLVAVHPLIVHRYHIILNLDTLTLAFLSLGKHSSSCKLYIGVHLGHLSAHTLVFCLKPS